MNRPAIFFDRDNTLIVNDAYLGDPAGVVLISRAAQAISRARALGYAVITVSNQAGVARGKFTEEAVHQVNSRMDEMLLDQHPNARIDRHEFCPYHPEGVVERYKQESDLRKPRPGMILRAADRLSLDLRRSWMIGDTPRDIEAGKAAGCRTILFSDPSIKPSWSVDDPSPVKPDFTVTSLDQALDIIEQNKMSNAKSDAQITSEEVAALAPEKTEHAVTEPAAESVEKASPVSDTPAEEVVAATVEAAVGSESELESPQSEASHASESPAAEASAPEASAAEASAAASAASPRKMTFAERVKAGTYQPARNAAAGVVVAERPKRAVAGSETAAASGIRAAAAESAPVPAPSKAPAAARAVVTEPGMKPTEPLTETEQLEPILQQILEEVRMMRQQHPGTEFAVTKLLAGIVQVLVLPALFFAYLNRGVAADFQSLILLATFLQTLTIALLIMGRQG